MKYKILLSLLLVFSVLAFKMQGGATVPVEQVYSSNERLLATREMSLEKRYANAFVNGVFKDNILLTLSYMTGKVQKPSDISWDAVNKDATYEIVLQPGEVFAYHDDVLPEYKGKVAKTTNAHFDAADGFRSSGTLYGDGVCHLASLMNWAAQDAGLKVESRVNHDFANIPEVPREYGTSIVTTGTSSLNAQSQNLYITNTLDKPVRMVFDYKGGILKLEIYK